MLREYLEEGLQDIVDKLENVKKEYYKNNNIADILNDKIEKSKSDMNADFSAFFPRSEPVSYTHLTLPTKLEV